MSTKNLKRNSFIFHSISKLLNPSGALEFTNLGRFWKTKARCEQSAVEHGGNEEGQREWRGAGLRAHNV